MPVELNRPDPVAVAIKDALIDDDPFHADLAAAEVSIGILMATAPEGEPAVKLHGYACAAKVKINSYADRVEGKPDATITIDAAEWAEMDDLRRQALIDHELNHLEVQRDEEGQVKSDAHGRPKLKIRLHDVEVGVFDRIIAKYESECLDADAITGIPARYTQLAFGFAESDPEPRRRGRRAAMEHATV
jgi:hypothetical protein